MCGAAPTPRRPVIACPHSPAQPAPSCPTRGSAEPELRRAFLQRREAWVAGLAAELDDTHPYEFLKRLTDVYRLHLFDVVMQYRAIFSDDGGGQVCERAADAGPGAGG